MIPWHDGKALYDHLNKRINLVLLLHLNFDCETWNDNLWFVIANLIGSNPIQRPKIVCQVGSAYTSNEVREQ